jgi:hypothetical protein
MDHRLADVGYQCWRTILPEETLAMKLGFVIPIVGPAVSGAPGLSAFCRGLEDLGYDTLWVGDRLVTPVDVDSSYLAHGPQMTRSLDPLLLWTVAAAATSRMRLNASTLSTFYYEPPHLARLLTPRTSSDRSPRTTVTSTAGDSTRYAQQEHISDLTTPAELQAQPAV